MYAVLVDDIAQFAELRAKHGTARNEFLIALRNQRRLLLEGTLGERGCLMLIEAKSVEDVLTGLAERSLHRRTESQQGSDSIVGDKRPRQYETPVSRKDMAETSGVFVIPIITRAMIRLSIADQEGAAQGMTTDTKLIDEKHISQIQG